MEDEALEILRAALSVEIQRPRNLAQAINERFAVLGGVDLPPSHGSRFNLPWTSANDCPRHPCHL